MTSFSEQNPYTAPRSTGDSRQPDWYLASACRYFKGIGYVMIAYLVCAIPFWFYGITTDESPPVPEIIGPPIMTLVMSAFFGGMIKTATQLPNDFERLYKRARWLGILAAAFGFPILTIPALIGVSRLSKYRELTERNVGDSTS